MSNPQTGVASVLVSVQLPETSRVRNQSVTMSVYGVDKRVYRGRDWQQLQKNVAGKPPLAINQFVRQKKLKVMTVASSQSTIRFRGQPSQAYLLVQKTKLTPFVTQGWVQPLMLRTNNQMETIEAKGTTVVEQPYFYKYGTGNDGTKRPLAGAQFVLVQVVAGQRLYLTESGDWSGVQTAAVQRFSSDKAGCVRYAGPSLSPGDYEFQEVEAPTGYAIDQAAQHVSVHVPASGLIQVQATALEPLVADRIPVTTASQEALRVYNHQLPTTDTSATEDQRVNGGTNKGQATVSQKQHDQKARSAKRNTPFWLPQTNEERTSLAVVGGLIILVAAGLLRHYKHTYTSKKER